MSHIVLVEPDYMLADNYHRALSSKFKKITIVKNAQGAIDVVDGGEVDLIITDTLISSNNGIEILYELRSYADWLDLPVIMLSSLPMHDFPISRELWGQYGISGFAYKPRTKPADLVEMAEAALA